MWGRCLEEVPFYQSWAKENDLPRSISTLSELRDFPVLTKHVIQERSQEIFNDGRGGVIELAYSTGGTTGEPTRFPKGKSDMESMYPNAFVGRTWWGIWPFDSYVHVWGHAHLFGGVGLRGRIGWAKRVVLDRFVNATRVSAYAMNDEALASHVRTIIRKNPKYLVGYTSAIFRIARYIEEHEIDVSSLTRLEVVLVTAETVTEADVSLIHEVFGAQVIIEYGSAETGAVAVSRDETWSLAVLWHSFVCFVDDSGNICLTTLDPSRKFPLVNYAIGDTVAGGDIVDGNALSLGAVTGRSRDVLTVSLTSGEALDLSPIYPVHILKSMAGVRTVQYRQESPAAIVVFVSGAPDLDLDVIRPRFVSELRKSHPEIDPNSIQIEATERPLLTAAGKQALFV